MNRGPRKEAYNDILRLRIMSIKIKDSYYYGKARSTCVRPSESGIYDVNIIKVKLMRVNIRAAIGIHNLCIGYIAESVICVLGIS